MEVARIHAENAIRQKNQSLNYLRMSARVDAVAARVQTAVTMNQVHWRLSQHTAATQLQLVWCHFGFYASNGAFISQVTKSMGGVVKGMDSVLKSMNLEKVGGHLHSS